MGCPFGIKERGSITPVIPLYFKYSSVGTGVLDGPKTTEKSKENGDDINLTHIFFGTPFFRTVEDAGPYNGLISFFSNGHPAPHSPRKCEFKAPLINSVWAPDAERRAALNHRGAN